MTASRVARTAADADQALVVATATVAAGAVLTMLPLRSVFTDWGWLTTTIGCALPYWLVVSAFRARSEPRWWHSLIGFIASILMLLWVFVPQHLGYGVLPTPTSFADVGDLVRQAREAMRTEHAPLASTDPLRLLTASALVLLAALTDVLGILLRRPLLAAAPLLEILAVSSATSSSPAHPLWFVAAAVGFLLILLAGTRLQDRAWGASVDGSAGRLGGARRMAATGILAALIVPLILPTVPVNLLARAAHHDGGGGSAADNRQAELSNFAALSGSLKRSSPVTLLRVQVESGSRPFYIRQAVLDRFSDAGWSPSNHPARTPLDERLYPIDPANLSGTADNPPVAQINAKFTVVGLAGRNLPLLANPSEIDALGGASWDAGTATVVNAPLARNLTYTEVAMQATPSIDELKSAPAWDATGFDPTVADQYLSVPLQSVEVRQLAARLTNGISSPYEKAKAISDYFTNGKNGFRYSLDAPPNDGRQALVTFLDKKQGFCQQYAAAAAVLMRVANVPSRVVLGYTHRTPDASGNFTVTTADAHAWVEAYFPTLGWIPFDPTPLAGADAARAVALPWASHPRTASAGVNESSAQTSSSVSRVPEVPSGGVAVSTSSRHRSALAGWLGILIALVAVVVLLLIGAGPRLYRGRQRRNRLAKARSTGNPESLWNELAASAADRDALWPDTITVGQVPQWLNRHGFDERGTAAVTAVAERLEQDRFSPRRVADMPDEFIDNLDDALKRWARRAQRRQRLVHRWLPKSLLGGRAKWRR